MRNRVLLALVSVLFLITAAGTASAYTESSTDLWNYQNISSLDLYVDGAYGYHVANYMGLYNAFGAANYGGDGTAARFSDEYGDGTVFSLRFTLNSAVTVKSFDLLASHDGGGRDSTYRGFKQFSLYSSTDGINWGSALYVYNTSNPYNGDIGDPDYNFLDLVGNITPTTSMYWRADFVQNGSTEFASGPRINELDGFSTTAVPEPVSTALFLIGGATLAARRMRK